MKGILLVENHLQAVEKALAISRWAAANHDARRVLRGTYQRYPWTRGLQNISPQQLANYVQTTLSVGITNAATTATLTSVAGLPTVGNFRLVITDVPPATTFEIVEVSSVNVGTGVVTFSGGAGVGRGLEGTAAIAHNAGAIVGNDITAAMLLLAFAQGQLQNGYAQVTVNQGSITALVDLTNLTITVSVGSGRRILLVGQCLFQSTVAQDGAQLGLNEGATVLGQGVVALGAANLPGTAHVEAIVTPPAGSHTYKLTGARQAGTGTITMVAAGVPAYIYALDIGQA